MPVKRFVGAFFAICLLPLVTGTVCVSYRATGVQPEKTACDPAAAEGIPREAADPSAGGAWAWHGHGFQGAHETLGPTPDPSGAQFQESGHQAATVR